VEDIKMIRDKLPECHKNFFFNRTKEEFLEDINRLLASVEELNVYEIKIEIAKIVASIGDAHTSVNLPITLLCPIEFYWFSDGIYIIQTSKEYKEILNSKVTHINGIEILVVVEQLSRIISYENEYLMRALLPKYLPAVELLFDLYIVDNVDKLELECELENGKHKKVIIDSYKAKEARDKLLEYVNLNDDNIPIYRKYPEKAYWYEYVEKYETLYFKYNACKEMESIAINEFCKQLMDVIATNEAKKLVVDLRNNKGGNSTLLNDFIEEISRNTVINKTGALFVIVGRDTFSSALLNVYSFKEKTKAVIVGEPTGGKPNCYGEVEKLYLKNSGLVINYSTKYYKIVEDDSEMALVPEILCESTINSYRKNVDPCMEYIIKYY
jgi:hypothetical protein